MGTAMILRFPAAGNWDYNPESTFQVHAASKLILRSAKGLSMVETGHRPWLVVLCEVILKITVKFQVHMYFCNWKRYIDII